MEKFVKEEEKSKSQNKVVDVFHNNKNKDPEDAQVEIFFGDCSFSQNYGQQQAEDGDYDSTIQQPVIVEMPPQALSKQVKEEDFAIQQPIVVEIQQKDQVCIQHLAEVEKLSEGQKFLRHLLKEIREDNKKIQKVYYSDQHGLQNLDELFDCDMLN